MTTAGRVWPLLAAGALAAGCAQSEDVEPSQSSAGASGSGGGGIAGGGGLSGGGFPSTGGAVGDGGGTGGGSGGGKGGCGPEVCNGKDDDCNGTADDGVCGAGCKGHEYFEHGYAYCSGAKTLSDAAAECVTKKMKLARPNDQAENDWLRTTATAEGMGSFWLGATDWTTEGSWDWPDGEQFWTGGANGSAAPGTFANWAPKHPTGSGSNDCMQMDSAGQWLEIGCGKNVAYVCEDY